MTRLFTHTFFERPVKLTVSPLTMHFAVIFKEFIKFCHFSYSEFRDYFTLKVKNVAEVKYVGGGELILLGCSDGLIHLIDAYTFEERVLMNFYGELADADLIDQRHLLVRSTRNGLHLFKRDGDDGEGKEFAKLYEVKLEEGDLYQADNRQIVVFRKRGKIELYLH
jgi:hypothetical protein